MSFLEIVAVVFSVACVLLSMYKNVWTWLVGIVGIVAYFYLFYESKLYGDMSLQIIYFGQSLYGWWFWQLKPALAKNTVLDNNSSSVIDNDFIPQKLSKLGLIYTILGLSFSFGISAYLLSWTNADLPYLDAAASSISLIANWLLARKVLENWLLWIIADALLVYIFISKELYLSAATYLLFLILAIFAFIKWQKSIKGA
jgi:nicotinamide mononucleotide transporter